MKEIENNYEAPQLEVIGMESSDAVLLQASFGGPSLPGEPMPIEPWNF